MAQFTTHTGMVDILPGESEKWHHLEGLVREVARRFHFREIRTPIMEPTEMIARGVGQLTDIVSKEMFAFDRGDDHYVLRPEGTASVCRAYIQHRLDQRGGTQRLFYIGPMFRAERPQKGRQRQFHQFGAEILGSADPLADAEVIAFMAEVYRLAGIGNTTLRINSVGDPESRQAYKEALVAYFKPFESRLSEVSQMRLQNNPMRILDSKEPEDQILVTDAPSIIDYLNEDCLDHYGKVKAHLHALGIPYVEDHRLVRGLDYYTKTAFELTSTNLGSQDALGGGGRYDLLIEELGGQSTPAVGFASGMERFMIACEALGIGLGSEPKIDVYIACHGESARVWAVKAAQELRNSGVSTLYDTSGRSVKAQMKEANREGAKWTIVVGDSELEKGEFVLRNMTASEEQNLSFPAIKSLVAPTS
jgi:histidyl-tRNA synthetase